MLPLALIYWLSPIDLLPLFPGDDILVMAAAGLAYFMMGRTPAAAQNGFQRGSTKDDDYVTTTWSVVDDE